MAALPRPHVPYGPVAVLFDNLHALHHRAGWPSLRDMAREVGCSHTTISVAFSEPQVPRWGLLELIVETLGGDTEEFHGLWLEAGKAERVDEQPPTVVDSQAPIRTEKSITVVPPRDLPADVTGFTGRSDQVAGLNRLLDTDSDQSTAVVISAVCGTAGVGKTALAVHWAHRVADRFPDGQLYVNLRGYDPDKPVQPAEALAMFLRELGVEDAAIPLDPDERAARYRTLLAGRRVLVVLDNAHSVDQVRPLLPGTPTCFVLVTSRDTLPALVARHGAVRVNLDLLSTGESIQLLRTLIGSRVDDEPSATARLVDRCARLPLALRIAAELAISRPEDPLSELDAELADERHRLDLLDAGEDSQTAVRAVFSWSIGQLTDRAGKAFRLLGLHPGREFDAAATAALLGVSAAEARRALGELTRAQLVQPTTGRGRFGMHDLLGVYAAEQAMLDSAETRSGAVTRLFDYYLSTASAAMAEAFPDLAGGGGGGGGGELDEASRFGSPLSARTWLDLERVNLLALARLEVSVLSSERIGRLAATLERYLDARAHYNEALALYDLALKAARAGDDPSAEAAALDRVGTVLRRMGRYRDAADQHRQAVDLYTRLGDAAGECHARHGLGVVWWRLGRYDAAREELTRALAGYRERDDRGGEGNVLSALGIVHRRLGRYREALSYYNEAVEVHRELGDLAGESRAMNNLGIVYLRMGRYAETVAHYSATLSLVRELGDRVSEGVTLTNLALSYEGVGRLDEALAAHLEAREIYREIGYQVGLGDAALGLGTVYARLGRLPDAFAQLSEALRASRLLGETDLETTTLNELGRARLLAGQADLAGESYRAALTLTEETADLYEQARSFEGLAKLTGSSSLQAQADALYRQLDVPAAGFF